MPSPGGLTSGTTSEKDGHRPLVNPREKQEHSLDWPQKKGVEKPGVWANSHDLFLHPPGGGAEKRGGDGAPEPGMRYKSVSTLLMMSYNSW